MKKSVLFFFVFLFAAATLSAQQNNNTAVKDSIYFDKTVNDYGDIAQGSSGECTFTFYNKGKAPLVLSSVNASCGCTTPEWPRNPVKPGESGVIKVKYNTQIVGHFEKTISVYSNAVNSPVVLRITGNVTSK
jgi:hypothetical protein